MKKQKGVNIYTVFVLDRELKHKYTMAQFKALCERHEDIKKVVYKRGVKVFDNPSATHVGYYEDIANSQKYM